MAKVIYMDINRCIFCRACEVACEREHGGVSNMFVQLVDERYAIPMNCRHCEKSPCTLVCPTNAIHRLNEDAVTIDHMKCIGCRLCTIACPFGAIMFDPVGKVAHKCDLCVHRLEKGLDPACVATCSARALVFGEFELLMKRVREKAAAAHFRHITGEISSLIDLPSRRDEARKG